MLLPEFTLSRRTIHALKASEATAETLSDAIQVKNRLTTSRRIRKPVTDGNGEPPAPNAKRSYGDISTVVENFDKLVSLVSLVKGYSPNEPDLTIAGLRTFASDFRIAVTGAVKAYTDFRNATAALNLMLYKPDGIYGNGTTVKSYMRSVIPNEMPQYREISKFKFYKR